VGEEGGEDKEMAEEGEGNGDGDGDA